MLATCAPFSSLLQGDFPAVLHAPVSFFFGFFGFFSSFSFFFFFFSPTLKDLSLQQLVQYLALLIPTLHFLQTGDQSAT